MMLGTLATIFGISTGLGYIPQIVKVFRTKSAKDLSIITLLIFAASSVVWLLYGIQLNNFPLIIANTIYVINYIFIISGWMIYGRDKK